jgi:peptidoglycan/LPS O-acetylase OafA/YrhL
VNRATSIYLDFVRFAASFVVFLAHATRESFATGWPPFGSFGYDAVMVFFVLSGYVIAFVASKKENTPTQYFVARFARLWSVVVPALILTVILDYIGTRLDYISYTESPWFETKDPLWRVFATLFFINELWFSRVIPFSNVPFWSLGYEFWYYVLFACLFFLTGAKRWVAFTAVSFLIGPKIILLLPIWLLGVQAYRCATKGSVNPRWGAALFFGSIIGYAAFVYSGTREYLLAVTIDSLEADLAQELQGSREFLSHYVVGILVAFNFIGFAAISRRVGDLLSKVEGPIRFLAGYTLSLYLLHYPLLHFFAAIVRNDPSNPWHQIVVLAGTLSAVLLVGSFTESKKEQVRSLIWQVVDLVSKRPMGEPQRRNSGQPKRLLRNGERRAIERGGRSTRKGRAS